MAAPGLRLIWCQGGNPTSAALAVEAGWWYGFRSDGSHYADRLGPVALLDCHWEEGKVDWPRHLAVAERVRPWLATVPDTMALGELDRTVRQAEQLVSHCDHPLVVPKCDGLVARLPGAVGGKPIVLGYSVPTSYGGTGVPLWEMRGRPVHLLGGNARRQYELCDHLRVVSADGNLAWRLARRGVVVKANGAAGPTVRQLTGSRQPNAHLAALRLSLDNLRTFWSRRHVEWRTAEGAVP